MQWRMIWIYERKTTISHREDAAGCNPWYDIQYDSMKKTTTKTRKELTIWKIVAAHSVCLTGPWWRRSNVMVLVSINSTVEIETLGNK